MAGNVIRHCMRCGKPETEVAFRDDTALKCVLCDVTAAEERRAYWSKYHASRRDAIKDLIAKHPKQFKELMDEKLKANGLREEVKV